MCPRVYHGRANVIVTYFDRHVLNCLVQNEPGVLSRVSGILAGRGFNIDSLVVCRTEIRDLSRMCVVLRGQDGVVEQARRQLEDLVSRIFLVPGSETSPARGLSGHCASTLTVAWFHNVIVGHIDTSYGMLQAI